MTAATTELTPAAHAYLRRATWGLPKERQQEVWDELEEHLLNRAAQLQSCGAAPPEALAHALAELGSPARVSAGMTGVYLMPKLILMAGAGALALSAALYALAGGSEGKLLTLPVLTQRPAVPTCVARTGTNNLIPVAAVNERIGSISITLKDGLLCYTFSNPESYKGAYISMRTLLQAVTSQGGAIKDLKDDRFEISFPQNWKARGVMVIASLFTENGEDYISASSLVRTLVGPPKPNFDLAGVNLKGYKRPTLNIGSLSLQFGDSSQDIGKYFYRSLGPELLAYLRYVGKANNLQPYSVTLSPNFPKSHRVRTQFISGEVVMLVTEKGPGFYTVDTAPVQADGSVVIGSDYQRLRFVSDMNQLK